MAYVIAICRWIVSGLTVVLTFVTGIPGMIVSAFVGIGVLVHSLYSNVASSATNIISLLDAAKSAVDGMMNFLSSIEYYGYFHHLFAFDVLGSVFSTFITLAVALLVVCVFDVFFTGVCIAVPFLLLKTVRGLVSIVSAGFVKP